jgi:hypothetical protein
MDIDGLGDALVNQPTERGMVKNAADPTGSPKMTCSIWSAWAKVGQNV